MSDPKLEAMQYLEQHKLLQLFELLGAKIAFAKPSDPNAFLSAELLKVSAMLSRGQPVTLFSEKDIITMFSIFDITGRGYVTQTQYHRALNAVGIITPALDVPTQEMIDRNTFVQFVLAEVMNRAL